jgi:gliding motility-associated-like protein
VTATNPGGCYSVLKVCVPNTNPLQTEAVVLQNAKCGLPTGAVNVLVSGGSGQYTYTLGGAPPFTQLQEGLYFCGISDMITGCTDEVSFFIEDIPVSATLVVHPENIHCPGELNGSVSISLTPGDNFSLPYSAVITDANGNAATSGQLLAGKYYIQVKDAAGCPLPLDSFLIETPPLFVSQALVVPADCQNGGQILLTLSGGTGPKKTDWADIPGNNNPEDRQNLFPGLYSATVYDSLGCSFSVNPILVTSVCVGIDTVTLDVPAGTADTFCMNVPVGIPLNTVSFYMQGAGTNVGSSDFGMWILKPNGCLVYTAGNTQGQAVDTICIIRHVTSPGLEDTVCVIVNIGQQVCQPIHNYVSDGTGTITWKIQDCAADTVFCSSILYGEFAFWSVTDNLLPPEQITTCGLFTGIQLDTGLHLLHIRNLQNTCSYDVRVQVNCEETVAPSDTTYAVADAAYTQRGTSVEVSLLENDVILGIAGNTGAVAALEFLNVPADGSYSYNPVTGVLTYTPEEKQCGPYSFTYQLTDTTDRQSTATVSITIICDKILIFNGISPNGDSLNDEWHLPGIEQYQNNEVRVFNRWGQLVFERTGYNNAPGWDGRWNGHDLPDGTYFYTIDLKDGSAVMSGFLQIQR